MNELLHKLKVDDPLNSFVLAGDLNARRRDWGDTHDNQRGKYLRIWEAETAKKFSAKIYPTVDPSYTPAQTYLDVWITNLGITDLAGNSRIKTDDYDSDHRALLFTVIIPVHRFPSGK